METATAAKPLAPSHIDKNWWSKRQGKEWRKNGVGGKCAGKPRTTVTLSLHCLPFQVVVGFCWVSLGDEFPRRLCDLLPPVVLFYHVSLQSTSGNIKQQSQGVGGHRVYVGIRHPVSLGIGKKRDRGERAWEKGWPNTPRPQRSFWRE